MNQILKNISNWKTSFAGVLVLIGTLLHSADVQTLVSIDPRVAKYVTVLTSIVGGLMLLLGAQDGVTSTGSNNVVKMTLLMLFSGILVTACTASGVIGILDEIVAGAEILVPLIPGLSPSDAAAVTTYADSALTISTDLIDNTTTAGLQKAIADFNSLVAPKITNPMAQADVMAIEKLVNLFVTSYTGTTVAQLQAYGNALVPPGKTVKVSAKDKARLAKIKARAKAAHAKLPPHTEFKSKKAA